MRLPHLNAFAKAQLWGMAAGFALALWATDKTGFGLPLFLLGWLGAWVGYEFLFGRSAPSHRSDARAIWIGIGSGFIIPWFGFALAAFTTMLRP